MGGLAARNSSSEGQRSTQVRAQLVEETKRALQGHEFLGVGPGEVENYRQKFGLRHFDTREQAATNVALESTYAELVVGVGIPGAALFLHIVVGAVASGLRSERLVGPACALLTFVLALNNFAVPAILQTKVFPDEVWIRFNTTFDTMGAIGLSWPLILVPLMIANMLSFAISRRFQPKPVYHALLEQNHVYLPGAESRLAAWNADGRWRPPARRRRRVASVPHSDRAAA